MNRMDYIANYVKASLSLDGDLAEAGVSAGDSAEAICKTKNGKPLYLFDTFTGLPESMFTAVDTASDFSRTYIYPNAYAADYELVRRKLSVYPNVHFCKGLIPKTFRNLKSNRYCFIHIDLDLYKSTLEALKYFIPRRVENGIIMIHNYTDFLGVRLAVKDAGVWKVRIGDHKYCFL